MSPLEAVTCFSFVGNKEVVIGSMNEEVVKYNYENSPPSQAGSPIAFGAIINSISVNIAGDKMLVVGDNSATPVIKVVLYTTSTLVELNEYVMTGKFTNNALDGVISDDGNEVYLVGDSVTIQVFDANTPFDAKTSPPDSTENLRSIKLSKNMLYLIATGQTKSSFWNRASTIDVWLAATIPTIDITQ